MSTIEKLTKLFQELPGIGPRQARRFVYAILEKNNNFADNLSSTILELKNKIKKCSSCFYTFENINSETNNCEICRNLNRANNKILVVERDVDLENIERSKSYNGKYFILGGVMSPLKLNSQKLIRFREVFDCIQKEKQIEEVIIATSMTREGEATALYLERILNPFVQKRKLKISRLGRGLSTGTEIEYSDAETIRNALENRK